MNPSVSIPHHHHLVPPVALGQLPTIGMVTAPGGSGGHVGIGIGIPIMTSTPLLQQTAQPSASHHHHHHHHGLVSPDSSEDGLLHHRPQSPNLSSTASSTGHHGNSGPMPSWSTASFLAGMGYPLLGMGSGSLLGEPNMYYGINLLSSHPQHNPGPLQGPDLTPMIPLAMSSVPTNPRAPMATSVEPPLQQTSSLLIPPTSVNSTKEIIHCKSCTLFPPNPSAPLPTTREKPSGCRTVFAGGLPENMTDDIVREVFERFGEITTIRMSKKNFCHIRFELESYVDNALYLSGYRIRIGSNSDNANIGRFHVDYAQARDDFFEWECRQRQHQREQRHRVRVEQERLLPPSPPPVVHYSEHEAIALAENIKVDENFMKSVQILITWFERGDCSKRNATTFYSMVQSTNSHVRRLLSEKSQFEEEFRKAKTLANQRMQGLSIQFNQVEKVFMAASHKKAWDHFTKAQRKSIESWKTQTSEMKKFQLDEFVNEKADDEMDLSDSDAEENGPQLKKMRLSENDDKSIIQLKEENDALRCQLEACKNEVDLIKIDLKTELEAKDNQLKLLQLLASGSTKLQQQISQLSPTQSDTELVSSQTSSGRAEVTNLTDLLGLGNNCDSSTTQSERNQSSMNSLSTTNHQALNHMEATGNIEPMILENQARIIGIISTFLHVHPFGASLEYICSFAQKVLPTISTNQIQAVLVKFPEIFRQQLCGVGASLERKWTFVGFSGSG